MADLKAQNVKILEIRVGRSPLDPPLATTMQHNKSIWK